MRHLVKYLRQTFIEDINVALLLAGLVLTIFCWTIPIFTWGIELLLLPVMLGIVFLMVCGPVILITYLARKNKHGGLKTKNLGRLKSLAFGTYLGFMIFGPINNWDEEQRQKSGLIISKNLEAYRAEEGQYPRDLSKIKDHLEGLPATYTVDKFTYYLKDNNDYDLDIPVAIMDRWHWDKEKEVFVYDDF